MKIEKTKPKKSISEVVGSLSALYGLSSSYIGSFGV